MSKACQEKKLGRLTVGEFFARFPDEDTCLTHIMEVRYGLRHVCGICGVEGTFHKLSNRRAFSCAHCGDHVYPTAGTVFQDTRTPLQVWFSRDLSFRHHAPRRERQRTGAHVWHDLQNCVADGLPYSLAHDEGRRLRKTARPCGGR